MSPLGRNLRRAIMVLPWLLFAGNSFAAEVVFDETFDDPDTETFEVWGTADPFNRVEVFDGALELEGSNGFEAFGVYFTQAFDLADGPLTIQVEMTRNSEIEGSEVNVWFVNQYLIDGDPWMQGDFIRAGLFSEREGNQNALVVQQFSPDQRGAGEVLAIEGNAFTMGERFVLEIALTTAEYTISIDGEELATGDHGLPATEGYLFIHDWNSIDSIDLVHEVRILQ